MCNRRDQRIESHDAVGEDGERILSTIFGLDLFISRGLRWQRMLVSRKVIPLTRGWLLFQFFPSVRIQRSDGAVKMSWGYIHLVLDHGIDQLYFPLCDLYDLFDQSCSYLRLCLADSVEKSR